MTELKAALARFGDARDVHLPDCPFFGELRSTVARTAVPSAVEGVGVPKRRFEAIPVLAGEESPVDVSCRVLEVSCAGFYATGSGRRRHRGL